MLFSHTYDKLENAQFVYAAFMQLEDKDHAPKSRALDKESV